MGRPKLEATVSREVAEALEAIAAGRMNGALSVRGVAKLIGRDRRTIMRYGLDRLIAEAARNRRKPKGRRVDERIAELTSRIARVEASRDALLLKLALIELNAESLGVDPEQLYRPVATVSPGAPMIYARRRHPASPRRGIP